MWSSFATLFICPSFHHHLPFIYPSFTLHLPFICPSFTLHLPFIFPSFTLRLSFICPSFILNVPFVSHSSPPSFTRQTNHLSLRYPEFAIIYGKHTTERFQIVGSIPIDTGTYWDVYLCGRPLDHTTQLWPNTENKQATHSLILSLMHSTERFKIANVSESLHRLTPSPPPNCPFSTSWTM